MQASKGLWKPSELLTLPLSYAFSWTRFPGRTARNMEAASTALRAQRVHVSHSSLLECLERFSSLCSVLRELNGIRPLRSAQRGNNSYAELVCRGCVSIVFAKPYVEFERMSKNMPGRDVVQSHFHMNIASCPGNPRKCENQETQLSL